MMEVVFPMSIDATFSQPAVVECSYKNCQDCDITLLDQSTVNYFKFLIRKYRKQMGDIDNTEVCSGGLQHYLITHSENKNISGGQEQSKFENLPVDVRLHIFSYLSARDLCYVSQVCQSWYDITQDNLLWQELLNRDLKHWDIISHSTNPALYKEVHSEWSNKRCKYLRCSPEVNQLMHKQNAIFNSISSMIRYFLPKKVPKFAMFGPGLETDTSKIVRKIMKSNTTYQTVGLFPGQFDGVGGGMTLKTQASQVFNLTILYSAAKRERELNANLDRMMRNKLVQANEDEDSKEKYELVPSVRDLCKTLDGFVYVVDASSQSPAVETGLDEMIAMVSERWLATHIPLLVLSSVPDIESQRLPCSDIVEKLNLASLNRPWQVRNCVSETLAGSVEGFIWLSEQTQRR